jgi:hypothetical protein
MSVNLIVLELIAQPAELTLCIGREADQLSSSRDVYILFSRTNVARGSVVG